MHDHEYDDDCEGCQPGLMDQKTGKVMDRNDPIMVVVLKAWKEELTLTERRAAHRVWMGQSQNEIDISLMKKAGEVIQAAIERM